jgi:DnaJ domain
MNEREAVQAYPLAWPAGWKRTPGGGRKNAQFQKQESKWNGSSYSKTRAWLTVKDGTERVLGELGRMGVDRQDVIISTNVKLRLDGLPRSGEKEPDDPGAVVYWRAARDAEMRCMAIDQYTTVADNLAALAATLEAMRAVERHGGAEILNRTFQGFAQLQAENEGPSWWGVLQVRAGATVAEIEVAYRELAKIAHPDTATGSHDAMAALNAAREQGLNVTRGRG